MAGEPSPNTGPSARPNRASALAKPITLSDLTEELLWPHLFRAVPLALRPERLGIAFFTLVVVGLLGRIVANPGREPARATSTLHELIAAVQAHSVRGIVSVETSLLLGVTWDQIVERPWVSAAAILPALLVLLIGAGAISRMAACEFSQSVMVPWTRGLAFSLSRLGSLAGAVLGPLAVASLLLGIVALAGGALFNWSVSAVLAALLYPVALVLGALAVLLSLGFALGHSLLVPAVTCEATDAIDAAQRSYAYVVGRPLRLISYQLILYAVLVIAVTVLEIVAFRTIDTTARAAAALAGPPASQALGLADGTPRDTWAWVARILSFWIVIPKMLVGAFVVSYGASASTVLYLIMRKLNDGQDVSEIWMPGMVGGTLSPDVAAPEAADEDGSLDEE